MNGKSRAKYFIVLLALAVLAVACGSSSTVIGEAGESRSSGTGSDGGGLGGADPAPVDGDDEQTDAVAAAGGSDTRAADARTMTGKATSVDEAGGAVRRDESEHDSGGSFGVSPMEDAPRNGGGNDSFADYGVRSFISTARDPLSTFALDVDTASYAVGRRWLRSGSTPPPESVRVEEYLNSFDYDYFAPSDGLNVEADGGPSPYDPSNVIVRIGVQAERVATADRPNAALTFVIDTSGSMDRADRLELVKTSLAGLVRELGPDDTVAIVTYSDDATVILAPTPAARSGSILDAIDELEPTGSTNLEAGLQRGYDLANESFQTGGINRVVLASDGVANVGLTDPDGLARLIRGDADRGIQLVTVGVGMGGFNDVMMEQLADRGDGFYAYVNDEREALELFGDDLTSTLLTVAIDGKIQVEFDDRVVDRYRLIGFENRAVLDGDFRNDAVDAGELGAGHQVTALYELALRDDFRRFDQIGTAQLRWEDPEERTVRETRLILTPSMIEDRWSDTDRDFRLAVTVAAFAEILRHSPHVGAVTLDQVADEAQILSSGTGAVQELAQLIRLAGSLR